MTESDTSDKPVLIAVLEESATRSSALASSLRLLTMLVESARSVVKGTESQRRFNVQFAEYCRSALLAREAWEHAVANSSFVVKCLADKSSECHSYSANTDHLKNEDRQSCNDTQVYSSSGGGVDIASESVENNMANKKEGVDSKLVELNKNANRLESLQELTSSTSTNNSTASASAQSSNSTTKHNNNHDKREKEISYYKKHGVSEAAMLKEIASYVASQTPHLGRRYVEHIALGVLHKSKRTESSAHSTLNSNTHLQRNRKNPVLQSPPTPSPLHSSSLEEEHVSTYANCYDASRKENEKHDERYLVKRRERSNSISSNNERELENANLCDTRSEHAKKKNAFDKRAGNVFNGNVPTGESISHFLSRDDPAQTSMQERANHTSPFDSDQLGELDEEVTHRVALGIVMQEAKKTAMAKTHSSTMLLSLSLESTKVATSSQTKAVYNNTPVNLTRTTAHQSRRGGASSHYTATIPKEENKIEEGVFVSHYRQEAKGMETRGNTNKMQPSYTSHASRLLSQEYDLHDPAQKLSVIPELNYRVQPWLAPVPSLAGVALDRVVLDKMERRSKMSVSASSQPSRFSVGGGSGIRSRHGRLPQSSESVNKTIYHSERTDYTNNDSSINKCLPHSKEQEQEQEHEHEQKFNEEQKQQLQYSEKGVQQRQERMNSISEFQQHHEMKNWNHIDVPTLYEICAMEQPTELLHAWERRESARVKFWNNASQSATDAHFVNNETCKESNDNKKSMHTNNTNSSALIEHKASEPPEQVETTVLAKRVDHKSKAANGALPANAFFLSRSVKENISMPWSLMVNHIHYGLSHLELPYAKREKEKLISFRSKK